jgi:hypothetical protein
MAPSWIVELFDVGGEVCGCDIPVLVDPFLDSLFIQTAEESVVGSTHTPQ